MMQTRGSGLKVQGTRPFFLAPCALRLAPRGGFTLFELLVVIVIFGGIMAALMVAFLISESSYHTADSYVQVQQEARRAFDTMVKELREAGWGTVAANPGTGGNCTFAALISAVTVSNTCVAAGGNAGNQIDFQIALGYDLDVAVPGPPPCPDAAVCWGAQDPTASPSNQANWSVRYWIDAVTMPTKPQLVRDVFNDAGVFQPNLRRIMANGVDAVPTTFTYNSANKTVKITLRITEQARVTGGQRTLAIGGSPDLETLVRLRN